MAMDDEPLSAITRRTPPPPDLPTPSSPSVPPPNLPPDIPPPSLPPTGAATPPPPPTPVSEPAVRIAVKADREGDEGGLVLAPFNTRVIAAVIDVLISVGVQIALGMVLPGFLARITWAVGVGY